MKLSLNEAIRIVKDGGIIIFPTDTAFGIGCRIDSKSSVARLYEIRKRSKDKAVPILFESVKQVKDYVLPFDIEVENLMKKYWPGALTIVLKCKVSKVPSLARGGGDTLGVRIPNHELTLPLIRSVGVPIIGTSANFAGKKTPFRFEGLDPRLMEAVDGILEDKTGIQVYLSNENNVSTVIDCTQKPWKILRQGAVVI